MVVETGERQGAIAQHPATGTVHVMTGECSLGWCLPLSAVIYPHWPTGGRVELENWKKPLDRTGKVGTRPENWWLAGGIEPNASTDRSGSCQEPLWRVWQWIGGGEHLAHWKPGGQGCDVTPRLGPMLVVLTEHDGPYCGCRMSRCAVLMAVFGLKVKGLEGVSPFATRC